MRLSLTTIVAPFTGAAPVPSISLPPFSTIICFLLASVFSPPAGAYLNCRDRPASAAVSAACLGKGYQHDESRAKPIARRLRRNARGRDGAVPDAGGDCAGAGAQTAQLAPPPPGLARVWFLRQFEPAESLWTPMIYVNGAPMTPSHAGDDLLSRLRAGNLHLFGRYLRRRRQPVPDRAAGRRAPSTNIEVQSLESFRPPDCPRGTGVFYVRPVMPQFPAALSAAARLSRPALRPAAPPRLPPQHHHLLDLGDRLRRVQVLRAGLGAVHDRVAAVEPERVLELVEPLAGLSRRGCRRASDRPAAGPPGRDSARRSTSRTGTRSCSRSTGCTPTARRAGRAPRSIAAARGRAAARSRSAARARSSGTARRRAVRSGTRSLTTGMCGSG